MPVVRVWARVVSDDTGIAYEMPVLITEAGHVNVLTGYLIQNFGMSESWKVNVTRSVQRMIEYLEANERLCGDPETVFASFATRLYTGTIGDDGLDPSGLGWIPSSTEASTRTINALKDFLDHAARKLGTITPNPLVKATSYDERLNYAAWFRKNQADFLGHLEHKSLPVLLQEARAYRPQGRLSGSTSNSFEFPRGLFPKLYIQGYGGDRDPRCIVRDRLILLLMDCGGCRESEPLHLWVEDVAADPANPKSALVKIFHPQSGVAPDDSRKRTRKEKRAALLRKKYGLTARNFLTGSQRVGWKSKIVDHTDNYMQVFWFPPGAGELFANLWKIHLRYLATVERHHPYAFVSYEKNRMGKPFSLNALNSNYESALARINQIRSKSQGCSTHGHRHAFSQRMRRAGLAPIIIRKALHQKSLASQATYTQPTNEEVTEAMNTAYEVLERTDGELYSKSANAGWDEILKHGFEDIDPEGLLSGPNPKLRNR
ncbi:site-specific integrase [Pseudomonas putida]|nr:site-specific integrase [Pseudomonas putida]